MERQKFAYHNEDLPQGVGLGSRVNVPLVFTLGECVHYREGGTHPLFKGEKTQRWWGEIYMSQEGWWRIRQGGVGRGQNANEQIS